MITKRIQFVPNLSCTAGRCLTMQNLVDAEINTVAIALDQLLMKPGAELLQTMNLRDWLGWPHAISLNATNINIKKGLVRLRSDYDGRVIEIEIDSLIALLIHLKPNLLIFSEQQRAFFADVVWPESITIFYLESVSDAVYLQGVFDRSRIKSSTQFFESATPMEQALEGQVYTEQGDILLTSSDFRMDTTKISAICACTTCKLGLNRAYFHHLIEHTPLLAHRFLIQHNLYWSQNIELS